MLNYSWSFVGFFGGEGEGGHILKWMHCEEKANKQTEKQLGFPQDSVFKQDNAVSKAGRQAEDMFHITFLCEGECFWTLRVFYSYEVF